jgi:hypothetical protein
MKKVDRQPDQKPVEPYTGGHDRKTESEAPAAPSKGKGRRPEARGGRPADRTHPEPEPRHADKEWFDNERSDRSSGRPVQLENQEGQPDVRHDGEAGRDARQGRQSAEEPLRR